MSDGNGVGEFAQSLDLSIFSDDLSAIKLAVATLRGVDQDIDFIFAEGAKRLLGRKELDVLKSEVLEVGDDLLQQPCDGFAAFETPR